MAALMFDFQEVINEIEAFSHLANDFIAPESRDVLPRMRIAVESFRSQKGNYPIDLEISRVNPLRTRLSRGAYEKGSGGGHDIYGEISSKWRIKKVSQKQPGTARRFELLGIASTQVRLMCQQPAHPGIREIAMWRMEIADSKSPGCYFHIQILGDRPDFPFPNSLPVPRLPNLMLTPTSVAEFVLAELFQDDWVAHMTLRTVHLNRWAPIQRDRWSKLLNWKLGLIGAGGSPWTTIKQQQPDAALFV